jgi:autotransporter-associated beta strand protein
MKSLFSSFFRSMHSRAWAVLSVASIANSLLGQTSYTDVTATGAWNTARWNNTADSAPYTLSYTANQNVIFTSGSYSFAGMGASTNVGNITVQSGANVTFATIGSTFATGGNVRTIDVASGSSFDFNGQSLSTAAGTGFIKNGAGVLGTGAGAFTGGFTLNAGTVIARGTTGLGSGGTNVLGLNGGTVASNGTRAFENTRFGGGIVIGGNVQFGELSTIVTLASSSASLSFANNVSLGGATRILTLGNNGSQTFSGFISNTGSGGMTFAANASTEGRFEITNTANTFTGNITVTGGEVRFTADGSLGNADNDVLIDGGRFSKASDATTLTLGSNRLIFVGDTAGTSISSPGSGVLVHDNAIADITGKTGSWAKQGGGVLRLGGESTYSGNTAINNGTVQLSSGHNRLPISTVLSLGQAASANLGTLDLNGFNQEVAGLNSITGTNATANKNTVTSATAATLTLGGTGTYTYSLGTVANSGVLTGVLALVKTGSGIQVFGEANTYSGGTTVSGGTLVINNASGSGTGTGAVTIASTGTLAGTGRIAPAADTNITLNGSVYVGDTTLASPVASILELATSGTGSTISSSSAIFYFDLFSGAGSEGLNALTTADHIKLPGRLTNHSSGTLVIGNPLTMTGFKVGDAWNLFNLTGGGSIANDFNLDYSGLNLDPAALAGQFDRSTGTFSITHVIPEPSRALLFILGLATLCLHRRRVPVTDP